MSSDGPIQFSLNADATKPWLLPLGKFVTNFGGIEFRSYMWMALLNRDTAILDDVAGKRTRFGRRVEEILKLARRDLDEPLLGEVLRAWNDALELARFRNRLLHNPIVHWVPPERPNGPHEVAVVDLQGDRRFIRLPEVNEGVNRAVAVAQRLDALWEKVAQRLDTASFSNERP